MSKAKGKKHVHNLIDSITLKTQLLSYIQAKCAVKRHLGYKCTSTLIFQPTHHNDKTCAPWCLVRNILTCNVGLKSAKCHFYLAKRPPFIQLHAHFFFHRFSPYAPSLGWVVLGLLGLELLEEKLSTHLGFFPYQGFYLDKLCPY